MTDFYDWLTAADSGLTADRLAESFRLSQKELRRATEALAPAFAQALRGAMGDRGSVAALASAFAPFADPRVFAAGEPASGAQAEDLAARLFGSPERTASLARRASLSSGIAPDILQKLIGSLSVLTMETMLRMMLANLARNQPSGFPAGDHGTILAETMRRGANAVEALARPSSEFAPGRYGRAGADLQDLFRDALTGRLPWLPPSAGAGPSQSPSGPRTEPAPAPDPFLPFAALMSAFAAGVGGALARRDPAEAAGSRPARDAVPRTEAPAPSAERAAPADEAGNEAFWESGRRMQDDYAREMTALFSRYLPAPSDDGRPE